ncbi:7-deoxyloganetin glucosyltransferase [Amborella trichopoda]|uniref:7-deoxyloganetin glucosyltransferase n=1 Tax=Amborella trichopoda TaxID=13333 RepID=UPI0005D40F64|nr:7-deoxyloganetin glucosyltransferase [Amborella trichopoda]|eukprot:XP_006853224.2 7-deoxyloganetin glucosyltransferase [Amborella trichopoda]
MDSKSADKPHALCIPYPAQGHINPMMHLAKLLHARGFYITFVNTEFNHERVTSSGGAIELKHLEDFNLESIPDGLPPDDCRTQESLFDATTKYFLSPFKDLVSKLNGSMEVPRLTCIISDGLLNFTQQVVEENGIPRISLWTTSACGYWGFLKYPEIIERGILPFKVSMSLWKEEDACLEWLNDKEPKSVLYVSFGSVIVLTPYQLNEFAWGLASSQRPFIWVLREDLVVGKSAMLEKEFVEATKERGLIMSWCNQMKVLSHLAISGFLTHNGWNSTLESICNGVPMICWPFFADQQTNCRYVCKEWGIGMEINNDVKREDVEALVREFMEGENGKEMQLRAKKWKESSKSALQIGGSSYDNFERLLKEVLLEKH